MDEAVALSGKSRAITDLDPVKLRTLRRQVKMLTQHELGQAAGISRGEVSHLETGKRKPLATTLRRLCVALECEPTDLLTDHHAPRRGRRAPEETHVNGKAGGA